MNALLLGALLLGQISKWQRLGDEFRRTGPRLELVDLLPAAIVLALVVVGIVVAVKFYKRSDFSKPCDDPGKMFRQLCAAHKLNLGSRRLLLQLAAAREMAHPAVVFVTPTAFHCGGLPPNLQREEARLAQLAAHLF
jgi:hypothetical protein